MKKEILAGMTALGLSAWAASAETQIHTHLLGWNGTSEFESRFAEDASKAMSGENEKNKEVCGPILVSNLPLELQELIWKIWGDIEQVRECTQEIK